MPVAGKIIITVLKRLLSCLVWLFKMPDTIQSPNPFSVFGHGSSARGQRLLNNIF